MRPLVFIVMALLPTLSIADMISVSVPSAVSDAINIYRADCAEEGGVLELDGNEISKLWTDQGEESYVIHAIFTYCWFTYSRTSGMAWADCDEYARKVTTGFSDLRNNQFIKPLDH